jgi:hypothetical protein
MPFSDDFPLTRAALLLAAALTAAFLSSASAGEKEKTYWLRGLFCNTEEQIDEALGYMSRNVPPRAAAELTNDDEIVCTYVDLLNYIIERPQVIGEIPAELPLVKYQGKLVGVVVGGRVRSVSPPAPVFFIARERLPGAVVERRA